jgi:predicted RNA-binding Zn-ribbon protein involved in translation (DUF1610 family)
MRCIGYENFELRIANFKKRSFVKSAIRNSKSEISTRSWGFQEKEFVKAEIRNPQSEIPTMPDPQIARRCRSCGASIRVRASFCPQCGKELSAKSDANRAKIAGVAKPVPATPDITANSSSEEPTQPSKAEKTAVTPPAGPNSPSPRKQPMQATVGMVHNPRPRKRPVIEEDGLNRIETFRQISSVIDEATYDPSLRFVLVAAVLFVLFLFLLLLSELMR